MKVRDVQKQVGQVIARKAPMRMPNAEERLRELVKRVVAHGLSHDLVTCNFARPDCSCGCRRLVRDLIAELDR